MIAFLGNCQAEFLAETVRSRGINVATTCLASPLTMNGPSSAPPERLRRLISECGLQDHLHGRDLDAQFGDLRGAVKDAALIVVNLFHETTPLHLVTETGDAFYVDPAAAAVSERFKSFLEQECRAIEPNPAGYLRRFETMLHSIRRQAPGVPVLVLTRLAHYPAFGPSPCSYLQGWGELQAQAPDFFGRLSAEIPDTHLLDMDRVFAGVWARSEQRIEAHCPFLKIVPAPDGKGGSRLVFQRDLEHVGTAWGALADKIDAFLRSGRVEYASDEVVPDEWSVNRHRPERLTADRLQSLLASGANYYAARAVAAFFSELQRDYTELLVACREEIPICHNTLHMIRTYAALRRNPRLVLWCRAHREKAEAYADNGVAYQRQYLHRIDEIEGFVQA